MQRDDENDSSCGGGVGTVRTAVHFNRTSWFYKSGQQLLLLLCGNIARLADYYMSLSPNCLPNGCVYAAFFSHTNIPGAFDVLKDYQKPSCPMNTPQVLLHW